MQPTIPEIDVQSTGKCQVWIKLSAQSLKSNWQGRKSIRLIQKPLLAFVERTHGALAQSVLFFFIVVGSALLPT